MRVLFLQSLGMAKRKKANICFRKAKDEQRQKISKAHMKMEEGRGHRGRGSNYKFLELFRQAVRLFHEASQPGNAAYCLEEMNCLEEAGGENAPHLFVAQNDRCVS